MASASAVLPSPIRCEADLFKIFPDPQLEPQPALGPVLCQKIASWILYRAQLNIIGVACIRNDTEFKDFYVKS